MGRNTFDVINGFEGPWPYAKTPVLVATNRPLMQKRPSVVPVCNGIQDLIRQAKDTAGEKSVYIDGGTLVRSALDAGLVDELTITIAPIALGGGISLFAGTEKHHKFRLLRSRDIGGGFVQLIYKNKVTETDVSSAHAKV